MPASVGFDRNSFFVVALEASESAPAKYLRPPKWRAASSVVFAITGTCRDSVIGPSLANGCSRCDCGGPRSRGPKAASLSAAVQRAQGGGGFLPRGHTCQAGERQEWVLINELVL